MDIEQKGTTLDQPSGGKSGGVRPTLDEAKATAKGVGSLGRAGVKPGTKRGTYKKTSGGPAPATQSQPIEPELPPFVWEKKDIALILGSPFTFGYAMGGPDHEHWKITGEQLEHSQCYDKMAYVVNRLAIRDPMYLILAVGIVEYLGAIGRCAATSMKIHKAKIADEEKKAAEKNARVPSL